MAEHKKIPVKEFKTREALEAHVNSIPPNMRGDYEISGTKKELALFHLSSTTTILGILCVVVDAKKGEEEATEVPSRGKVHPFGHNGQVRDEKGKLIEKKGGVKKVVE